MARWMVKAVAVTPGLIVSTTVTVMVGLQVAELSPVMPLAVTAAVTAVRFVGLLAVYVACLLYTSPSPRD